MESIAASASADSANPPPAGVTFDDLKQIDVNMFSQSELQGLSQGSKSAFDVRRTDDVVTPQLDSSIFNESSGSRRQTYSPLHHRSIKPNRHTSSDPTAHAIVHFLKHLSNGNQNPPPPPQEPSLDMGEPSTSITYVGVPDKNTIKRKRGRKIKDLNKKGILDNGVSVELQRVNGKGEVIDFDDLENKGDELCSEELKRRTMGLETEEGALGFLQGLEGLWCSRRNKRKYVDSSVICDVLPVGWKILLGLRRRDSIVSVYCRRFISPTDQQFLSCKAAAAFLKSYFGGNGSDRLKEQNTSSTHEVSASSVQMIAHPTQVGSPSRAQESDESLIDLENLSEVKVQDIFKCFNCNLTFDEKDAYLEHLFTFHGKITQRCKIGTPIKEVAISTSEVQNDLSVANQKFGSVPGSAGGSVNLGGHGGMEDGINTSVGFGSEEVVFDILGANRQTLCIWCNEEFQMNGIESESPSDLIGYMCPICKDKISGHMNGGL